MISCIVSRGSLVQQNQELICTSLIYVAELLVKQFMGIVSTLGELSSYDEFVQNAQKDYFKNILRLLITVFPTFSIWKL